jgi:resuscitation-promoting factor RpfB
MAYRYPLLRRYRRRLRSRNGRLAGSAVAAGLVLAVITSHHHGTLVSGTAGAAGASQLAASSGNVATGQRMAAAYGWTGAQWSCLDALWTRESGWNAYAANPASDARGIPQDINGWNDYAPGDVPAQVAWGLAYIRGRYGTPCAAWAHETAWNWY